MSLQAFKIETELKNNEYGTIDKIKGLQRL